MKVLLVGTGGVGEAIATIAKERPWVEQSSSPITTATDSRKCRQSLAIRNVSQSNGSTPANKK